MRAWVGLAVWQSGPRVGKSGTGCQGLGPARLAATGLEQDTDSQLHSPNELSAQNLDGPRVISVTTNASARTTHPPLCASRRLNRYERFRHAAGDRLQTGWCMQAMAEVTGLLCVLLPVCVLITQVGSNPNTEFHCNLHQLITTTSSHPSQPTNTSLANDGLGLGPQSSPFPSLALPV